MTICEMAGCVAAATYGGVYCAAHRAQHAGLTDPTITCAHCKGTGLRFYSGQNLTMACQRCGGTGLIDRRHQAPRVPKKDRESIDARGLIRASEKKR